MDKRGVALIFAFLVIMVLAILLSSFFLSSMNENNLVKRYVSSVRAFWLAEAGIAKAIVNMPDDVPEEELGGSSYTYFVDTEPLSGRYYQINSTGSVLLPTGGPPITRSLIAVVQTDEIDPTKFKYGIETTTTLTIKGSVDINPDDSKKELSDAVIFQNLFGHTTDEIKSYATHLYTPVNFGAPVDGITWVDVPTGQTLTIAGNLVGTGILVVSGNTHFSGTVDFTGIIYVIGELTMTGTVTTYGSVLAESSATVDTELKGNVTVNYDTAAIENALQPLKFIDTEIVAWRES